MTQELTNSGARPIPFPSKEHRASWIFVGIVLLLGVIVRLLGPAGYCEWMDRDIQRTLGLLSGRHIPLVGPEMNSGGYLPGPFLYVLMSPAFFLSASPFALVHYNQFLNIASILLLLVILKRFYSSFTVLVSVMLVSFSMMHIAAFSNPINPAFILFLNVVMLWSLIKTYIDEKDWPFIVAVVLTALGSQIHLSFAVYAISLCLLTVFVRRPRWRVCLMAFMGTLMAFVPFFVFRYFTRGIAVSRNYQQFSTSESVLQWLPKDVFCKIFGTIPVEAMGQFVRPWLASRVSHTALIGFRNVTVGIELVLFCLAIAFSSWFLVSWGLKTRCRFTTDQRKLIVPLLAVLPMIAIWQWGGIARHAHHWYAYIFFPIAPVWIGASLEAGSGHFSEAAKALFRRAILGLLVLLAVKPFVFYKESFFRLREVVEDIRDVKQQLGLAVDRFRTDVYFLDRPCADRPDLADAPFQFPPWGTYTDYLYDEVASDIVAKEAPKDKCYLIGHKSLVDHYSIEYYLKNIQQLLGITPDRRFESARFVFFQYTPRPDGNRYHNTLNAWVETERLNYVVGNIQAGHQSLLLRNTWEGERERGSSRRQMEFAVFDRRCNLPLRVLLSLEDRSPGHSWKAELDSGQLMGHLNVTPAYSGLYRQWPKLWVNDVRLCLEKGGKTSVLSLADGEVGRSLLAPVASRTMPLGIDTWDGKFRLYLVYTTIVEGEYLEGGQDIQILARNMKKRSEWETRIALYDDESVGESSDGLKIGR